MGVLDVVARFIDERRWIQLTGNHEAQYLPDGTAFWRDRLPDAGVARLREWWTAGSMRVAAAVRVVPFGQIHGHSTIVGFADQRRHCAGRVRQRATVDWHARHVRVRVGGRVFIGVDPGHGRAGAAQWQPLLLDGAELCAATPTASWPRVALPAHPG